jgi:energy-coupling factor transport system permease protein
VLAGYLPRSSFIHRLNPLTKLVWLCVAGSVSFIVPSPSLLAVMLVVVAALAAMARIGHPWLVFMRTALPPALAIAVINVLMSPYHGDRMLFASYSGDNRLLFHQAWGPLQLTVTAFGLQKGILLGLRWLGLVAPAGVFIYTTRPEDFAAALSRLRVPHSVAFAAGAALRLIPVLIEDIVVVVAAQRARGLQWDRRLISRARFLPVVIVPLIGCSIRRATDMAAAMETRAYGATAHRTSCYPPHFRVADACAVGVSLLVLVAGILSRVGT